MGGSVRRKLMIFALSSIASVLALAGPTRAMQSPGGDPDQVPTPPEYYLVDGRFRIDGGRGDSPCNETTVAISEARPLHVVSAWNDYRSGAPRIGVGLSLDGGRTWTDSLLRPPVEHQSSIEADPMSAFDDRTGTLWVGGLSFGATGGVFVARKAPGSTSFENVIMAYAGAGVDKGLMAAGPDPSSPETSTLLHIAFNQGLIVSADLGSTWSPPIALDAGIGFVPCVGPSGTLYVAYWDTLDRVKLIRSLDGGATVEAPSEIAQRLDVWGIDGTRTPGDFRVASFPSLAVDPITEALYCVYADSTQRMGGDYDVDIYFTRSMDHGSTWSSPAVARAGVVSPGDQFFPWIDVDRSGRIHMVFYDTRHTPQFDAAPQGWVDAKYSFSSDQGATWTEQRLTDTSFSSEFDGFGGIFLGDYLGIAAAGGRAVPVYMTTEPGNADTFANVVTHGAATAYCRGYACPCGNVDPAKGCGNWGSDGDFTTGADLSFAGTNRVHGDDLRLALSGLPPLAFGLLLASRSSLSPPFGDGRRCLGGQVFRYPIRRADAAGALRYGPSEVVALSRMFAQGAEVQPGSTWHYQGWYRDSLGPCGSGFNLTNGLSVTWR